MGLKIGRDTAELFTREELESIRVRAKRAMEDFESSFSQLFPR